MMTDYCAHSTERAPGARNSPPAFRTAHLPWLAGCLLWLALALYPATAPAQTSFAINYQAADLAFDPNGPYLYATVATNKSLLKINLTNGTLNASYSFDYPPESIAITPNGRRMYVMLLRNGHPSSYTAPVTNNVAEFDLVAGVKLREFVVYNDARTMTATDNGLLILSQKDYYSGYLTAYWTATGVRATNASTLTVYGYCPLALHPSQQYFYNPDYSYLEKYAIDPVSGALSLVRDTYVSGRVGYYAVCHPNGTEILTGYGHRFATSTNPAVDLTYLGQFTTTNVSYAAFDAARHAVYAIYNDYYSRDIRYFNSDSMELVATVLVTNYLRVVGFSGNSLYAVTTSSSPSPGRTVIYRVNNPAAGAENNLTPIPWCSFTPATPTTSTPILFDASGSDDEDPSRLLYRWDWEGDGVFDTPFTNRATAIKSFPFGGTKNVKLQVKDPYGAVGTMVVPVNVAIGDEPGAAFSVGTVAAEVAFDPLRPFAYVSDYTNRALLVVNLTNGFVQRQLTFDYSPESMALTPNGQRLYVALLPNGHPSYYSDPVTNYVAEFDLATLTQTRLLVVSNDVSDMVVTDAGLLALSAYGQMSTYWAGTGARATNFYSYSRNPLALHPSQQAIYQFYSGGELDRYGLDWQSGMITNYRWASVTAATRVFCHPNGSNLLTQAGQLLTSSDVSANDMKYLRTLDFQRLDGVVFDAAHQATFGVGSNQFLYFNDSGFVLATNFPVLAGVTNVGLIPGYVVTASVLNTSSNRQTVFQRWPNPALGSENNIAPLPWLTTSPERPNTLTPVTFDASGTDDDQPESLRYRWDWNSDGVYDTPFTNSPLATHLYGLAGTNTITLQVMDRYGLTATLIRTIVVELAEDTGEPGGTNTPWSLDFAASQVVFDPVRPYAYVTSYSNKTLHVFNLTNGLVQRKFVFGGSPQSMTIIPNGQVMYIVLLAGGHPANYNDPVTNTVAEFDLEELIKVREFTVGSDAYYALATSDGRLLLTGGRLNLFDVTTGASLTNTSIGTEQYNPPALHPSERHFYLMRSGSLYRYNLDDFSRVNALYDSSTITNVFCAPDGQYVFTGHGWLYAASTNASLDLRFLRVLDGGMTKAVAFDPGRHLMVAVGTNRLWYYNSDSLLPITSLPLPINASFVGTGTVGDNSVLAAVQYGQTYFMLVPHPVIGSATNTPPAAAFSWSPTNVVAGTTVTFDASGSSDAEEPAEDLLYRWDWDGDGVFDTPFIRNPVMSCQFKRAGTRFISVQVKDRFGAAATLRQRLDVPLSPASTLPGETNPAVSLFLPAIDVVFDPVRPLAYVASNTNQSLVVVNLETGFIVREVALEKPPLALAMMPSGQRLYLVAPEGSNVRIHHVTEFDLAAQAITRQFLVTNNNSYSSISRAVVTEDGFLAVNTDSLNVYSVSNGVRTAQLMYDGGYTLALHPSGQFLYTTQYREIEKFQLSATGAVARIGSSPYYDSLTMGYYAVCDPDGQWLLVQGGHVFTTTLDTSAQNGYVTDLRLVRSLEGGQVDGAVFDPAHAALFTVRDRTLCYYDTSGFELVSRHSVGAGAKYVGLLATNLVVVSLTTNQAHFQWLPNPALGNATNQPPTAFFTYSPTNATAPVTINFDASLSTDDMGVGRLQFCWDWESDGTNDTTYSSYPLATHRFETAGSKRVTLKVKDRGGRVSTLTQTISIASGGSGVFEAPFLARDVAFDPQRPLAYASDYNGKQLAVFNLTNGLIERVFQFDWFPESITISPDGSRMYVALLRRNHSSYWFDTPTNYIAEFDLETQSYLRQFMVIADPYDMVVTDGGLLIMTGGSDQWTDIDIYRTATGEKTGSRGTYEQSRIALHPSQLAVYTAENGLSPSDNYRYDFDPATGAFTSSWDSPYHGDYPLGGNVFCHPNGTNVISRGGTVLTSSNVRTQDLRFVKSLTNTLDAVLFAPDRNLMLSVNSSAPSFSAYWANSLQLIATEPTPAPFRFIGRNQDWLYLVAVTSSNTLFYPRLLPTTNAAQNLPPQPRFVDLPAVVAANTTPYITVDGHDVDGFIADLRLYADGILIGRSSNATLRALMTNTASGTHTLRIEAQDNFGARATNTATILANRPPTFSVTNSTSWSEMTNIVLGVSASDPDGQVAAVEFYYGNTLLGVVTSSPYTFVWSNPPPPTDQYGTYYSFRVVVRDDAGLTTSGSSYIYIYPRPRINITYPANYQTFAAPTNLTITVSASSGYSMRTVQFFSGNTLLAETNYWYNGVSLLLSQGGTMELTAKAIDGLGGWTISEPVSITVKNPLRLGLSPAEDSVWPAGSDLPITASGASDAGVWSLEVFANAQRIAQGRANPLTATLPAMPLGHVPIQARMEDRTGDTLLSPVVHLFGSANNAAQIPHLATLRSDNAAYLVDSAGQIMAWGDGDYGALGSGNNGDQATPILAPKTLPPNVTHWLACSAGQSFVLAIANNGSIYGWGQNNLSQLASANLTPQYSPVRVTFPVGVSAWAKVVAGTNYALALGNNGLLYAWGDNANSQLGVGASGGTRIGATAVVLPPGVTGWKTMSAGRSHSLAVGDDGRLYAWGAGAYGKLGIGNNYPTTTNRPVLVSAPAALTNWTLVAAGEDFSAALTADGLLFAWGRDDRGQLGDPNTSSTTYAPKPVALPAGVTRFTALSVGRAHCLALGDDGQLYAWGDNTYGQVGYSANSLEQSPRPIARPREVTAWLEISAGWNTSYALGDNLRVYVWGTNTLAQLGGSNLLVNGGFELPGGTEDGTYVGLTNGATWLVGWTVSNVNSEVNWVRRHNGFQPAEGDYHLNFNGGNTEPGASVAQTFATAPGTTYTVSFQMGCLGFAGPATVRAVVVTPGGQELASSSATAATNGWGPLRSFEFVAVSPQTTLRLVDETASTTAVDLVLDNVVVREGGLNAPRQITALGDVGFAFTNLAPAITVTPLDTNQPLVAPASLTFTCAVDDPGGSVAKVEIWLNGERQAVFTNGPYALEFTNLPAGDHRFTVTAVDNLRASNRLETVVTVLDNTPPVARCKDVTVAAGTNCLAEASVDDGSYDPDPTDVITIVQTPAGPYPLGANLVTLTVIDNKGASNSCTATVTVVDATPPQIACPADILVNAPPGANSVPVTFTVTATDFCDPHVTVVSLPPSGSLFPVGTTLVLCVATDASGNRNTCSFSVRVNAQPEVAIVAPTNQASFVIPQPMVLLANATDPDGDGIAKVDFYDGTNWLGTAAPGGVLTWTNAPAGVYSFRATATDTLGAVGQSSVVVVTNLAQPPVVVGTISATNSPPLNQSGLFAQLITINNPTAGAFPALRVLVQLDAASAAKGARVWNATGTNATGAPYLQYNQPVPAGQSVNLTIEYYVPDRRTLPAPTFTVEIVPAEADPNPTGTTVTIDRVLTLPDGAVMVEFATQTNRVYFVQYSSDMVNWKTALPAVSGTGSRVQWFDNGPPITESLPSAAPGRFYRVLLLP